MRRRLARRSLLRTTERDLMPHRTILVPVAVLLALAAGGAAAVAAGPAQPSWDSLSALPVPEWLQDAKFGIYAHWGLYSVPAFGNEWYAKRMYEGRGAVYEHHKKTYGDPSTFGYKDFIARFKAEKFDPAAYADAVAASGAKFAGIAVVHHDGFLLWASKVNRWNAGAMGPKRDVYGDLAKAFRERGLKTIATFHHIRTFDWYLPTNEKVLADARQAGWDLFDPKYADLYWNRFTGTYDAFVKEWDAKVREVINAYHPDVVWFDGGKFQSDEAQNLVLSLLAHYHNQAAARGNEVGVLNKLPTSMTFNFPESYGMLTFEEGRDRPAIVERPWMDDMKISTTSWGYIKGQQYKPANEIVDGLVDRTARGGGLLLSLCPLPDGTLNAPQKETLAAIGAWLKVNGEAIFGTRPWTVHAEGGDAKCLRKRNKHTGWKFDRCDASDIRFTRSKDGKTLYAIALGAAKGPLVIRTLKEGAKAYPGTIGTVQLLGSDAALAWKRTADGLCVEMPAKAPSDHAVALKITPGE